MAQRSYSASAPGSMMLLGEHAVLHHNQAIVCAIDQRITVTLYPQDTSTIIIRSSEFPEFITTLDTLVITAPYDYVLATLQVFKPQLKTGCLLEINSTFSATVGFGSSAAVTVALVTAIAAWLNLAFTKVDIFNSAKQIILMVQGAGSAADVAASIYGGVVHYTMRPFAIEQLPLIPELTAVYSGAKLATKEVLKLVAKQTANCPVVYQQILQTIHTCVEQAVPAFKQTNWALLAELFAIQHGLMVALGVSSRLLDSLVWQLQALGIKGAKISGSGLGDCVIGLGSIPPAYFPVSDLQRAAGVRQLAVQVTPIGVLSE